MGIIDRKYEGSRRKWRLLATPGDFLEPICPACGLLYDSWEESWECHWDEIEEEAIFNEILAHKEGRITGEMKCDLCGMRHFTRKEADICCTPGGLDRDENSPIFVFPAAYFRVVDYRIYDIIASLLKKMSRYDWLRSPIAKHTMIRYATKRPEKMNISHANRIRKLDNRIVGMLDHKGFFKED